MRHDVLVPVWPITLRFALAFGAFAHAFSLLALFLAALAAVGYTYGTDTGHRGVP